MTNCINCTNEINEKSNSSEHFLPHSIGWKSSSKFILCKRCNSNFGTGIDDALFQNFRFICTVLNVYREKGRSLPGLKIYPKKKSNYLWLQPGGILTQPKPYEQIKDGIWYIYTKSVKELNRIIAIIRSQNPDKILIEEEKDTSILQEESYYTSEAKWSTGNLDVLKSLVKSSMVYYVFDQKIPEFINSVPTLLIGLTPGGIAQPITFRKMNPEIFSPSKIYHTISIIGSFKFKKLVCVIELFSTFKYFILLNSNYPGLDFVTTESQNCIDGTNYPLELKIDIEELNKEIQIPLQERSINFQRSLLPLKKIINEILLMNLKGKKLDFDLFDIPKGTYIDDDVIDQIDKNQYFTRSENLIFS